MRLKVSVSPHIKAKYTIPWLMKQVIVGLIPVIIASLIFFRLNALITILVCVVSCIFAEWLVSKLTKRNCLSDYSGIVTGLLLALTLPPSIPWFCSIIGSFFAIFIVKHIFGGLGCNIFNPALGARAFLMATFPVYLTTWHEPVSIFQPNLFVDSISKATPLSLWKFDQTLVSVRDLFWGNTSGSLGETSCIAIILGGLYILIRKVGDWRAPLGMFISLSLLSYWYVPLQGGSLWERIFIPWCFTMFSGGVMLGMFFMCTDPVTTPITKLGRWIFGLLVGIMVFVFRKFSGYPEGVMFAILFMNMFVPIINRVTKPKSFGKL